MTTQENDRLKELFRELPKATPPAGMEARILARIEEVAAVEARKAVVRKRAYYWLAVAGCLLLGIGVPFLTFSYFKFPIDWANLFSIFSDPISVEKPDVNWSLIAIGAVGCLLLSLDAIIRHFIAKKNQHQQL